MKHELCDTVMTGYAENGRLAHQPLQPLPPNVESKVTAIMVTSPCSLLTIHLMGHSRQQASAQELTPVDDDEHSLKVWPLPCSTYHLHS